MIPKHLKNLWNVMEYFWPLVIQVIALSVSM
jgi:hypothetical protein